MVALGKKWSLPSDRSLGGSFENLALCREVPRLHASVLSYYCNVNVHSKIFEGICVVGSSRYFQK